MTVTHDEFERISREFFRAVDGIIDESQRVKEGANDSDKRAAAYLHDMTEFANRYHAAADKLQETQTTLAAVTDTVQFLYKFWLVHQHPFNEGDDWAVFYSGEAAAQRKETGERIQKQIQDALRVLGLGDK